MGFATRGEAIKVPLSFDSTRWGERKKNVLQEGENLPTNFPQSSTEVPSEHFIFASPNLRHQQLMFFVIDFRED